MALLFALFQSVENKDLVTALWGPDEAPMAQLARGGNATPALVPIGTSDTDILNPSTQPITKNNAQSAETVVAQGGFPLNETPKITKISGTPTPTMTPAERAALTVAKALEPSKKLSPSSSPAPGIVSSQPSKPQVAPSQPTKSQIVQSQSVSLEPIQKILATSAPITGKSHFIQLGAFLVKSNSENLVEKLEAKGFSAFSRTRTVKASMHVVFIGGFSELNSGQTLLQDLENKGFEPFLNENTDGNYDMVLGKFVFQKSAENFQKDLNKQGILTNVKKTRINARQYIVRMEGLPSKTAALQQQKELESQGFKTALIGLSSRPI